MNLVPLVSSGLLLLIALTFLFASAANLEADKPFFPTSEERAT